MYRVVLYRVAQNELVGEQNKCFRSLELITSSDSRQDCALSPFVFKLVIGMLLETALIV